MLSLLCKTETQKNSSRKTISSHCWNAENSKPFDIYIKTPEQCVRSVQG